MSYVAGMRRAPSTNWNERAGGQAPSHIILHYTGTQTSEEALSVFLDPAPAGDHGPLSPHYLIDGEGGIYRIVDEDKRAWHAGKSAWKDITDMNSASIGIEIWNTGHMFDLEEYKGAQIESVIELIRDIRSRWDIPDAHILGHSDIACGRATKTDPGEKFPWRRLEVNGIGLMPDLWADSEDEAAQDLFENPDRFYDSLRRYGYTYTEERDILLREFRRHFVPHLLEEPGLEVESCMAILSLLRQSGGEV